MTTKETGGATFPSPYASTEHQGLTVRDYFAAKALPALIAGNDVAPNLLAKAAYEIADAMLQERK